MKYFVLVLFIVMVACQPKPRPKVPGIFNKDFNAGGDTDIENEKSIFQDLSEVHLAVKSGDLKKLKALLNQGEDIHVENKNGQTAFHIASANGHLEVVKFLFTQGMGVDKQDKLGYTALQWASLNGHDDVVQELLIHNANLALKNKITEGTALHLATFGGHVKVVQILIKKIKEGNTSEHLIVNKFGQTPYEIALERLQSESEKSATYQAIVDEFEKSFPSLKSQPVNDSELEPETPSWTV